MQLDHDWTCTNGASNHECRGNSDEGEGATITTTCSAGNGNANPNLVTAQNNQGYNNKI